MGQNLLSPTVYWRRRMTALAGSMAVLTLVTWGVAGALGGGQASGQAAARTTTASGAASGRSTAARHGSAEHGRSAGAAASGTSGASGGQAASPGLGAQIPGGRQGLAGDTTELRTQPPASPRPSATPSPSHTAAGSGCAHGGVVLTLHLARHRYTAGEALAFAVDAVSTVSQPCRVNLGSKFVSVVVASGGTPLWDSASCPRGTGSRVVTLRRGVPAGFRVTWDRRTSISGCRGRGSLAPGGRYTAAAYEGQIHSHAVTFVLSG